MNSVQLWRPLDDSLGEVSRVLRPGARLVVLTHDWSIARTTGCTVTEWITTITAIGAEQGLVDIRSWRATAEHGRSVAIPFVRAPAG